MMETIESRYDAVEDVESSGSAKPKKDQPNISHLEDAVRFDEAGRPYLDLRVGDTLIIERHTQFLPGKPWLDTKPYYVNDVDQATGNLKLFFEELQQHVKDNFVIGLKHGCKYKKMPVRGRWDVVPRAAKPQSGLEVEKISESLCVRKNARPEAHGLNSAKPQPGCAGFTRIASGRISPTW